jgi:hypothetical protein
MLEGLYASLARVYVVNMRIVLAMTKKGKKLIAEFMGR